ncbi:MAG: hypothetical protein HXX12_07540 [Geothrix sp.]|uniref:hypothetical protein n=1 Tax=Geothrix sp. TaxID=1962974 RepID=UPI0018115597|nr:hypothetical protein [Geothrix sp.]NWJ40809.1 hypothetical protein [Geothrix sp.]WIL21189.1 MAG: hypothetical protein QOZ81_000438 [Geothrix sp.]
MSLVVIAAFPIRAKAPYGEPSIIDLVSRQDGPPSVPRDLQKPCIGWLFGYDVKTVLQLGRGKSVEVESMDSSGLDIFPFPGAGAESGDAGMIAVYEKKGPWLLLKYKGRFCWFDLRPYKERPDIRFTPIEEWFDEIRHYSPNAKTNGWSFEGLVLQVDPRLSQIHESPSEDAPSQHIPITLLGKCKWKTTSLSERPISNPKYTNVVREPIRIECAFIKVLQRKGEWLKVSLSTNPTWEVGVPAGGDVTAGSGLLVHWDPKAVGWIRWRTTTRVMITSRSFSKYGG